MRLLFMVLGTIAIFGGIAVVIGEPRHATEGWATAIFGVGYFIFAMGGA
jgi:hypothetical protein